MAVSETKGIIVEPLNRIDPRYPMAFWYSEFTGGVNGDLSGGTAQITITMTPTGIRGNSLWSIEYWKMLVGSPQLARYCTAIWVQALLQGNGNFMEMYDSDDAPTAGSTSVAKVYTNRHQAFGGFINNPRSTLAQQLLLRMINDNAPTNYQGDAWGYIWDAKAVTLAGGPIRPGTFIPELKILPV